MPLNLSLEGGDVQAWEGSQDMIVANTTLRVSTSKKAKRYTSYKKQLLTPENKYMQLTPSARINTLDEDSLIMVDNDDEEKKSE